MGDRTGIETTGVTLRDYQVAALEAIDAAHARGVRRSLVALPTGTGKTVVFSSLLRRRGGTALILAHRDELLRQAADKIRTVAPELAMSVGFVQAARDDVGAPVVIGSVQTIARQSRLDRLPRWFDTVVVDEAHHATADSYRRVLDHVETDLAVGFTATPERADKQRLADVWDELVYGRSLLEMIEDGYLCDLRGVRCRLDDLDLSTVKVTRGEYQTDDLGRALTEAHAPQHTAAALRQHAPERKTLVFCPTVALAAATAQAMRDAGIPTAHLHGETPLEERRQILRDLAAGDLRAVTNVDVLTEGYDEPSIDCVAIAAPTRSRIAYVQRVGRGTRLHPGKTDCLVLDLVGVTDDLQLQSLPALFDLPEPPRAGETVGEAVARHRAESEAAEERQATLARVRAERVELFGGRDGLSWLSVGDRWVVGAGRSEYLVLDPHDDQWRVLLMRRTGARVLASGLDLGYAQGAAEEALRRHGRLTLAHGSAAWRRRPPTANQLALLRRLHVAATPDTAGDAADLITDRLARDLLAKLDGAQAPEVVPA